MGAVLPERTLHQLVDAIPESRRWTADKRRRWIEAMIACVDAVVDLEEAGNG